MKNKQDTKFPRGLGPALGALMLAMACAGCQVQPPAPTSPSTAPEPVAAPTPEAAAPATPEPPAKPTYLAGAEGEFSLASFKGRPLLVSVQGVGTPGVQDNLRALNTLQEAWSARGLAVVGLLAAFAEGEDPAAVAAGYETIYPRAHAAPAALESLGGVRALPTHILIDASGKVIQRWPGAVSAGDLTAAVKAAVESH